MELNDYKLVMRAVDLSIRTYGNQEKKGPVVNVDLAGHCDSISIRFFKDGWKPDLNPTVSAHIGFDWYGEDEHTKFKVALDYIEGEIKAWEDLNGTE